MNATHPNDATLLAMAQNELSGTEHADAVHHLCECQQCRSLVQDSRELVTSALAEKVPRATDALLARIQGTRAAGTRVTLDASDATFPESRRSFVRYAGWTGFAVAAGVAAMVMLAPSSERNSRVAAATTTRRDSAVDARNENGETLLDAFSPFPSVALAQSAPLSDDAPLITVDANAIRPGVWTYTEYAVTDGKLATPSRMLYTSLESQQLNGREVWLLIETSVGHGMAVDTVWLDKATFRPIQRRWHVGHLTFNATYSGNHVDFVAHMAAHGANTRDYTNKHSATVDSIGAVIAQEAQLRLVLRTQKLHAGWRGVIGMAGPVAGKDAGKAGRMALSVEGSTTIKTSNDEVPCWRVISTGTQEWYVSKRSGEVVQTKISVGNLRERRLDLFTTP